MPRPSFEPDEAPYREQRKARRDIVRVIQRQVFGMWPIRYRCGEAD